MHRNYALFAGGIVTGWIAQYGHEPKGAKTLVLEHCKELPESERLKLLKHIRRWWKASLNVYNKHE